MTASPSAFSIRPATPGDYARLCGLIRGLDEMHSAARPDMFRRSAKAPRSRDYIAKLIAGPSSALLVAEHGKALIGFVTVIVHDIRGLPIHVPRRVAVVDNLFVDAAHRKRGCGRALMAAACKWAHGAGARDIEVSVHEFNREALRFYETLGYRTSLRRLQARVKDGKKK
jgi:ribosomal protein S18 acetylase RimI-like enzyme